MGVTTAEEHHRLMAIKPKRSSLGLLLLTALYLSCSIWLLFHHPMQSPLLSLLVILTFVFSYRFPYQALVMLLALFPCFSFAPWTGWLVFEEFDILLLLYGSAVFARQFFQPLIWQESTERAEFRLSMIGFILIASFTLLGLVNVWHGMNAFDEFSFSFFTNYLTSANALRSGKAYLLAPAFMFIWFALAKANSDRLNVSLIVGMSLGLAVAATGCVYERVIFTGLSNLSTDYRTTAWFWEMHLGGAALDAYLAVTIPFAMALWPRSEATWAKTLLILLYVIVLYVVVTTFSRAVYLAIPLSMFVMLMSLQRHKKAIDWKSPKFHLLLVFICLVASGTLVIFSEGGYRASLAMTAVFILWWWLISCLSKISVPMWFILLTVGLGLLWPQLYISEFDKLPYLVYAICWILAFLLILSNQVLKVKKSLFLPAIGLLWLALNMVPVMSKYWNEEHVYQHSLWLTLALYLALTAIYLWTNRHKSQLSSLNLPEKVGASVVLLAVWMVCSMFSASSYIDERFSTVDGDTKGRVDHWQQAVDIQQQLDGFWTGAGIGRFVEATYRLGPEKQRISTFSLVYDGENPLLMMHTGNHPNGYGEVLRITQQVTTPEGIPQFNFRAKTEKDTHISVEVCEKQLLYRGSCARGSLKLFAADEWKNYQITLDHENLTVNDWGPVRHLMLMFYSSTENNSLLLDDIQLIDATGKTMLQNGDFSQQMAFWFFTSDRNHMPYHLKNLIVHVLFEQGVLGVSLTLLLTCYVLGRILVGRSHLHPLAPMLGGAIIGLMVIGLFDSVIDAGRMAWLFQILLWLGVSLAVTKFKSAHAV